MDGAAEGERPTQAEIVRRRQAAKEAADKAAAEETAAKAKLVQELEKEKDRQQFEVRLG